MTFIVTLIALAIERFFDWSHVRRFNGFFAYQRWVTAKFVGKSPYLLLVLSLLPPLICVGFIELALSGLLYGLAKLIFSLLVLLYCLGPKNLWADSFASLQSFADGKEGDDRQILHRDLLNNIFLDANTRIFAVIFWYVLLGPLGAVLYRLTALLAESLQEAHFCQTVLDFLPIRLLTFFFALCGHFTRVFPYWAQQSVQGLSKNDILLTKAGAMAISQDEEGKILEDGTAEKSAIGLLDRSFVIFLIVTALMGLLI